MAFNSETPRVEYTASASQELFTFLFKIYDKTDLVVYQTPVGQEPNDAADILTVDTDYTVTISGDNGGSIELTSAATAGDALTLLRELPAIRDVEYQTNGDLLAETLNDDQDYQTYLLGDQQAKESRNVTIPNSSQGVSTELPSTAPDSYLKWNSDGTALENDETIPDAVIEAAQSASDAADSATEAAGSVTDAAAQVALATIEADRAEDEADTAETEAVKAANSAASIGNSANNVITNGLITSGALALPTTEVTGSIPILYEGNGTSKDVTTPMQIANDNGDGTTLATDWATAQSYTIDDIYIDNSTDGDALAYRLTQTDTTNTVSPRTNANWTLETNQYGGRFWFKTRDGTHSHALYDSARRIHNRLKSDDTAIEADTPTGLTAFNVNSVSLGSHSNTNTNLDNYVLWVDQTTRKTAGYRTDAGDMQNSKNNTGTDLMATDSAGNPIIEHYNPTTGFSIIMDTGNGVAGRSIPHSLQNKPSFFTKKRLTTTANDWSDYNKISGAEYFTHLNTTAAQATQTAMWNDTEPTEENLTVGTSNTTNENANQYISYLQADSDNHYIGAYTGTGAVGNVVDFGLDMTVAGSYVMMKRLSSTGGWSIIDTVRGGDNVLYANLSDAEGSATILEFTTTGIILNTTSTTFNASGYIYLIQAYSPKYSQPTGGSLIDVNSGVDLTYTQGIGETNLQETTSAHIVDLSAFAGDIAYILKERGSDALGVATNLLVGQSRPLGLYGDELVTNGTFDTDTTGWTAGNNATLTVSNGLLNIARSDTDYPYAYQGVATVIGRKYRLQSTSDNGGTRIYTEAAKGGDLLLNEGNNPSVSIEFTAMSTTSYIHLHADQTAAKEFDNISLKDTQAEYQGAYLNTLDKVVYDSGDVATDLVALGECKVDTQGNAFDLVEYEPLQSYFNSATFTGEVSLDKNVFIVDFGIVFNDQRITLDNPFGNENYEGCIARAEVYYNGVWSGTGFIRESDGRGTSAHSNLEGIVVQTGDNAVLQNNAAFCGSGHGGTTGTTTSAPCRCIITKIGDATDV